VLFMYGMPTTLPVVGELKEGMPAIQAGLKPGDKIISVNHKLTPTWGEFSDAVRGSNGAPLSLEVDRPEGATVIRINVNVTPRREEQKTIYNTTTTEWIIGVMPRGDAEIRRMNPISASYHAVTASASLTAQLVAGLAKIVTGGMPVREALGGPIAIARMAGQEARQGLASVAMFTVMLSLNLGLLNLLPVPLLDGGHLAFFVYEGVRGKPLAMRHREIALQVGLFLLVALMAFAIFNDISRIVQG
jgi:regulator of sigma E protease